MESSDFTVDGNPIEAKDLRCEKAQAIIRYINHPEVNNFTLVNVKTEGDWEVIILEVHPQIPQKPTVHIKKTEKIAVHIHVPDHEQPRAYALRKDFPIAKHLYPAKNGPKRLCLTTIPYEEEKYYWTASGFLHSIFNWLSKTSKDKLHENDQPLEDFFFDSPHRVLLPNKFFHDDYRFLISENLICTDVYNDEDRLVALLHNSSSKNFAHTAFLFETPPVVHFIPRVSTSSFAKLQKTLEETGFDLKSKLATRLSAVAQERNIGSTGRLILLIRIPKKRNQEADIENYELQSFFISKSLEELCQLVLGDDLQIKNFNADELLKLPVLPLNPTPYLTPSDTQKYNGLILDDDLRICIIGLGAIGSQISENLYRSGHSNLTLIDHDVLLPHNLSRHSLDGRSLGKSKVEGMKNSLSTIFEKSKINIFNENILHPTSTELQQELENADLILDFSASNIVSKYISTSVESSAPRITGFLNPNGKDSVLISESSDRIYQQDTLELDYYRALFRNPILNDHLNISQSRIGYSYNCRDVSTQLSQLDVAQHSSIISRALITLNLEVPHIWVWKTQLTGETKRIEISSHKYGSVSGNEWTIKYSFEILDKIFNERVNKLPNETGGVLMGHINLKDNIIYLSDSLKSPSDSEEYPHSYIRGKKNLQKEVEYYSTVTANQINYIGEWHSHPNDCSLNMSGADKIFFGWLKNHRNLDSLPPLLVIVGDNELNFIIEKESNSIPLHV